ncbi:riboflavin biosynthesis protein RibD [Alphaproteobacteria bacterium]|nr:riboflavin biosynthesis protein RibD [Alphaproteobacteria bacterium]
MTDRSPIEPDQFNVAVRAAQASIFAEAAPISKIMLAYDEEVPVNGSNVTLALALALALRGKGYTKTNPCVGAIIVKDAKIVGAGWHKYFGGDHAEIMALKDAGEQAEGADIYVTLEPCTTYGKTPPCTQALINSRVKRVFIGVADPNPKHAGKAASVLNEAGIETVYGVNDVACAEIIEDFTKFMQTGIPYVTAKIAQSLDGKIATNTGDSKWITSEESRRKAHMMRKSSDAVLVGIDTVIKDNPELTVRNIATDRQPTRIVFDSKCRIPLDSKLVVSNSEISPLIVVVSEEADKKQINTLVEKGITVITAGKERVDIVTALRKIGELNIMNILVEGGSTILGAFLKEQQVDRVCVFTAPILIGGDCAKGSVGGTGIDFLRDAIKIKNMKCDKSGDDFVFEGKLKDYTEDVLSITRKLGESIVHRDY